MTSNAFRHLRSRLLLHGSALSLIVRPAVAPSPHPQNHSFHLFKRDALTTTVRFSSTSSSDDLEGLIDPDDELAAESSPAEAVSPEQFAFLFDTASVPDEGSSGTSARHLGRGPSLDDAVVIANSIRDINDGFGDKTQKFLRQYRGRLGESLVIEVLHLLRNPDLGVKFFMWAGRQIGYSHTNAVYDALLEILTRGDNNDRISDSFLREIKGDDREVLGKLLNVLVRRCCRNGLWNSALEELGRLKDLGYRPTCATYNALVQVFLRAGKVDSAHLVHREMVDSGCRMEAHTLGLFAFSLCRVGKWRDALALIEREDFIPDTILYTKMISGLCEASLFDEAMSFLDRMRSSSCVPNVVTYSVLLSGCMKKRELGRCKRVLNMMIPEGCYPSPKIFNSLVHTFCRSRDYSYAYKLLKKMVRCGYNPGYVVYNILIGGICGNEELPSSDEMQLAEKSYSEMLEAGIVLNKVNVSNFSRCLCGVGKFEKAHKVIQEMMSKGFIPDSSTYTKVIGYLCDKAKVEKAFSLFEEMKRNNVVPDVYTYTILIDSFCKVGLIEQANEWFNEMVRDGCVPNVVTYTALIHAHLKAKKFSRANELFEVMLSEGVYPNIITYSALIDGHCKAGEIERACQIYSKMRGNVDLAPDIDVYFKVSDTDLNSKEPNVFTYGALVDGLCKAHRVNEARELLDAMQVGGCEPNHVVYDALIDGFCKVGRLDEAQEVFAKMSERGYNPSLFTYGSLIDRLFKEKRLDLALKVLSKMLENSCAPNVVIYTQMVDGLCKVGKTDEAFKLMLMMEEKGCCPNVVTYTAMIDGFGRVGQISKCLDLLKQMSSKGCAPNFVTYGVLINHCCGAGLLDDAYRLLEEMKLTYWPKHVMGYRKVIEGFSREFMASLGLLEDMSESDSVPLIPFYRVLIDSFVKSGRLEVALDLHKEIVLSSSSFCLNGFEKIYESLIQGLSLAYQVDKAFELYSDLIRRGGVPELTTFVHLIRGLIRINKWEEALLLSDSIQWMVRTSFPLTCRRWSCFGQIYFRHLMAFFPMTTSTYSAKTLVSL
ncbi:hypothetical protein CDL15_Pgr019861 [Punica granatum]|uniref:Pentatricopeptide repeat-containing protein At1g06710, mitochondrial n=1 Tax=Punica granatum TaxID=22663 RepID=A0A218W595_PUNGR|nr:hypothetical protein CDL15_Pgr019861 [Punica granatum]